MTDGTAATARAPVDPEAAPPVFTPPPGQPRFPLLDGVRAIAALTVFGVHLADTTGYTAEGGGLITQLAARLNVGVTIFFVLSGFLLYRPWVASRVAGRPGPAVGRYLWRRALRIAPAYWVALAVMGVLGWIGFAGGWWRYAFFLQIYDPYGFFSGITPAWSLCTEVTFYLALPLWVVALRRASLRTDALALLGLGLFGIAFRAVAAHEDPGGMVLLWLPAHLDWFAAGMGLAVLSVALERRAHPPAVLAALVRRPELSWALAAAAYVAVCAFAGLPFLFEPIPLQSEMAGHVGFLVVAVLVVLPAAMPARHRAEGGPVVALLRSRAAVWVGLVSYGLFLWHKPIMQELIDAGLAERTGGAYLVGVVALAASLAIAWLSYRLVEAPALRFKDARMRRRDGR